ncbi:hypothetical protein [Haloplanus sp. C73]|uniref:hypothetical protein n=1 Tax=Haloplanus sp. C73 TaxID=3421641 RepID=UPI003EBCC4BA
MYRYTRLVEMGATVVAVVLSIVSTVLALARTGLTTHADQAGWPEAAPAAPAVDAADETRGESPWV